MDDFGALVKHYGINPKGKSAPMAESKNAPKTQNNYSSNNQDWGFSSQSFPKSNSGNGSLLDDHNDDIFGFNSNPKGQSYVNHHKGQSYANHRSQSYANHKSTTSSVNHKSTTSSAKEDVFDGIFQMAIKSSGLPTKSSNLPTKSSGLPTKGSSLPTKSSNLPTKGLGLPTKSSALPTKSSVSPTGGSGGGLGGGFDFDMDSMFKGSMNSSKGSMNSSKVSMNSSAKSSDVIDDDLWGFSEKRSTNVGVGSDDLLSSDPVDDFWGKMANLGSDKRGVESSEDSKGTSEVLIPGFESANTANDRAQASAKEKKSGISSLEELEDFATGRKSKNANGGAAKSQVSKTVNPNPRGTNFFDVDGGVDGIFEKMEKVDTMFHAEAPDLDSFFSAQTKRSTPIPEDTAVSTKAYEEPNLFSGNAFVTDKKVSPRDFPDDFSSLFEGSAASGVFEEVEGESEERRRLRFARHQRTKTRMEHAVAEMNQREFEAQQEQEEKHRIADAMDIEMKRWAAGKEGNLRALLSSLPQVLGPESGWQPVTLTDLITSSQVKVAYRKAALCIHPDKVQQRGANLQQKFVAEKAFDILKEAWKKFSAEELR